MSRLRHLTVGGINSVLYTKNNKGEIDDDSCVIIDLIKDRNMIDPREFVIGVKDIDYCLSMKYSEFRRFVILLVHELANVDNEAKELLSDDAASDPDSRRGPLSS